jgi:hypothetical protein
MFDSSKEKQQLVEVIKQFLPKLSVFDNSKVIDLLLLVMTYPLYFDLPLIRAFPAIKLSVLGNARILVFFAGIFVDFIKFVSSIDKELKSRQRVVCFVLFVSLVVVLHILLHIIGIN